MSWQYRMLVVFAAALAVLAFIDSPVFAADMEKTHEEVFTMQEFVSAWHPGWNLGNTFDATGSETSWGNPHNQRTDRLHCRSRLSQYPHPCYLGAPHGSGARLPNQPRISRQD